MVFLIIVIVRFRFFICCVVAISFYHYDSRWQILTAVHFCESSKNENIVFETPSYLPIGGSRSVSPNRIFIDMNASKVKGFFQALLNSQLFIQLLLAVLSLYILYLSRFELNSTAGCNVLESRFGQPWLQYSTLWVTPAFILLPSSGRPSILSWLLVCTAVSFPASHLLLTLLLLLHFNALTLCNFILWVSFYICIMFD